LNDRCAISFLINDTLLSLFLIPKQLENLVVIVSVGNELNTLIIHVLEALYDVVKQGHLIAHQVSLLNVSLPNLREVLPDSACSIQLKIVLVSECRQ
jgi:hypothetical protein